MAHIHEKIDFTASVFIVHEGKVLLHVHKKLGIWLQFGGHIELDEDPNQAVIREAKEESGFDIEIVSADSTAHLFADEHERELIPPRFLNRHWFDAAHTHEHVDPVYFGRVKGGELRPEEEDGEVRWFSRDEIERNDMGIKPRIRAYALAALEELGW